MTEWFTDWFGEDYLRLYPHRDEADAAAAVGLVAQHMPLADRQVLDLCCGPGRHIVPLTRAGAQVTGFDLSRLLLARARQTAATTRLVRGDVRHLPFATGRFDGIVNLFTSFGYFAQDAEHEAVLHEAARLLKPRGRFLLDFLNASRVRDQLVPDETRDLGGHPASITRRITPDDRHVEKTITLHEDGRQFIEQVRLYSIDDLATMLTAAGLTVQARFGAYDGTP